MKSSDTEAARALVAEMLANGAVFRVTRRDDGTRGFLWEMPKGGNRFHCRDIIAEAKLNGARCWQAFVEAILEQTGGAP
jgi:hypothetical protein